MAPAGVRTTGCAQYSSAMIRAVLQLGNEPDPVSLLRRGGPVLQPAQKGSISFVCRTCAATGHGYHLRLKAAGAPLGGSGVEIPFNRCGASVAGRARRTRPAPPTCFRWGTAGLKPPPCTLNLVDHACKDLHEHRCRLRFAGCARWTLAAHRPRCTGRYLACTGAVRRHPDEHHQHGDDVHGPGRPGTRRPGRHDFRHRRPGAAAGQGTLVLRLAVRRRLRGDAAAGRIGRRRLRPVLPAPHGRAAAVRRGQPGVPVLGRHPGDLRPGRRLAAAVPPLAGPPPADHRRVAGAGRAVVTACWKWCSACCRWR